MTSLDGGETFSANRITRAVNAATTRDIDEQAAGSGRAGSPLVRRSRDLSASPVRSTAKAWPTISP